jgi:hypothetical protein
MISKVLEYLVEALFRNATRTRVAGRGPQRAGSHCLNCRADRHVLCNEWVTDPALAGVFLKPS